MKNTLVLTSDASGALKVFRKLGERPTQCVRVFCYRRLELLEHVRTFGG